MSAESLEKYLVFNSSGDVYLRLGRNVQIDHLKVRNGDLMERMILLNPNKRENTY